MWFYFREDAVNHVRSQGYTYSLEWGWSKEIFDKKGTRLHRRVALIEFSTREHRKPWSLNFYLSHVS